MKKILLGCIIAIFSFAIFFYAVEYDRSILQIIIGFALFIFPFSFLPLFKSTAFSSILVFFTLVTLYIIFKKSYYDTFLGILLAAIIGGYIYYFKVRSYKLFSTSEYKKNAKILNLKKNNKV
jgi:hypothetical protein